MTALFCESFPCILIGRRNNVQKVDEIVRFTCSIIIKLLLLDLFLQNQLQAKTNACKVSQVQNEFLGMTLAQLETESAKTVHSISTYRKDRERGDQNGTRIHLRS